MFTRRNAHKPNDDFLREFQAKFYPVAAIPYTHGAGIVPDQFVPWNTGVIDPLPALPPSPVSSPPPLSRMNCSCSVFNSGLCAVLHRSPPDDSSSQGSMPQYQGNNIYRPSTEYTRELSDSHLNQPIEIDKLPTPSHSQQAPRYEVVLHAPTATYNPVCQTPITYLNRRQGYKISVIDTKPPVGMPHPVRYRTHFRVGFENKDQRADPVTPWKLWRDHRGLKEATRADGQLRAVEHVDVMSNVIHGCQACSSVALDSSSLDGFSVVWIADPQSGQAGCETHIRFNFLSTDFTLSKGIQGMPLRLCAKTELLSPDTYGQPGLFPAEISYCKIKLFRDHGSERKLSNDALHLQKAIDKIQQKLDDPESGVAPQVMNNPGKRKRGKLPSAARQHFEPCLMTTHDFSASDELRKVKADLEQVLSSSQPRSILSLQGDEQDDPDRLPIMLSAL